MILNVDGKEIQFFPEEQFVGREKVCVSVSGGADSAILLYLLAKYTNKTLVPVVGVANHNKGTRKYAEAVINFVRSEFPDTIIEEETYLYFDESDRLKSKSEAMNRLFDELGLSGRIDVIVNGLTATPSMEEMEAHNFTKGHPDYRVIDEDLPQWQGEHLYKPFINVDKKFISGLYEQNGLLDTLYPLTQSCVRNSVGHCEQCWWCKERYWAFGKYS